MRVLFQIIFLTAAIISICSCSPVRLTNIGSLGKNKRTVTFRTHHTTRLNGAEEMVASAFLRDEKMFISKYVEINYDSVNHTLDSLYSNLNYWNKIRLEFSRKRQYRLYASVTGTDHLLDLNEHITYDTIRTPDESNRIWDHLWENSNTFTKELVGAKEAHYITETYHINNIKYKLRYIDGHSGKTLWSMRCRWPRRFFGSKKQNPALLIKTKFDKNFPYKLAGN